MPKKTDAAEHPPPPPVPESRFFVMWQSPWIRYGTALGFALGGFFDGILLHQILQWHHLLSLVPGVESLRAQVLWDGWFHVLMYVIAAIGLWGLWRAHRGGDTRGGPLLGALLVGFGLWHIADTFLSHWILGIHRIRVDSERPLLWDLIWLAAFGLAPAAAGWMMLRSGDGGPRRATAAMIALTLVTAGAGAWAMRPPADQPFTTVVFRPGVSPAEVLNAVARTDARLVWTDPAMSVVVLDLPERSRWSLYRQGALLVSGSGLPAGCFEWSRA